MKVLDSGNEVVLAFRVVMWLDQYAYVFGSAVRATEGVGE